MSDSLEILKKLEAFSLSPVQKINLSCAIQLLDGISTRRIKENLRQMSNVTSAEQKRIKQLMKKNNLSRLRQRSSVNPTSIFKKEEFLELFLKKYPSPQYVNLPFADWDFEILKHYLEIVYRYETSDRRLKDILSKHPISQILPFLTISRDIFDSDKIETFLLYIRFIQENSNSKYTHFVPIKFDCLKNDVTIYKEFKITSNYEGINIFNIAENYLPKSTVNKNAVFLILYTTKTMDLFRKNFLEYPKLPKSTFIFIKYSELKKLALANQTTYIKYFFDWLNPWYKKIKDIPTNENPQFFTREFKTLKKRYKK